MITFQTVADVTADRRVVLALPPEVPTGKVEIAVAIVAVVVQPHPPRETRVAVSSGARESADGQSEEERPGESLSEMTAALRAETRAYPLDPEEYAPASADLEDSAEILTEGVQQSPAPAKVAAAPGVPAEGQAPEPPDAERPSSPGSPSRTPAEPAPGRAPVPANGARARPAPATALQLSLVLGSYRLTKKLGQGRLGPVYLAHQASLQRDVVLKVLSPELAGDPDLVERFVQEAQRMARLRHPNILQCFEVGQALGHHFLALDYVEEGSAGTWLKKLGKFPLGDSLCILLSCCEALQYAHELKVVHGDIKPDNVMLVKRSGVKIADAGLLRSHGGELGLSRTAAGAETLFYLAPEQLRDGKHPDPRSDLYSLGCLLYVFLTGEVPFKGRTLTELIEAKERGTFRPARDHSGEVPTRLDRILEKLLAVKPEERYASCAALILDLEALRLANKDLAFLRTAPAAPMPVTSHTPAPAPRELRPRDLEGVEGYWYLTLAEPDGTSKVRKVTYRQVLAMLKKKAVEADTPASRSRNGVFRALGSYPEFNHLAKGRAGKFAEQIDLTSWLSQEAPKKGSRERGRWRERLWPTGPKRKLIWGGAAAVLVVAWFIFSRTVWFWRLQNAIVHWF